MVTLRHSTISISRDLCAALCFSSMAKLRDREGAPATPPQREERDLARFGTPSRLGGQFECEQMAAGRKFPVLRGLATSEMEEEGEEEAGASVASPGELDGETPMPFGDFLSNTV